MNALIRKANSLYKVISSNISIRKEYKNEVTTRINNNQITILNTSLGTSNLGDEIIMFYIKKNISEYLQGYDIIEVSTHLYPTKEQVEKLLDSKYVLIYGTNILSPRMELYSGWKFDERLIHLHNVILIGTGWWGYQHTSAYSKYVYKRILSTECLQSVRDEQTCQRLRKIGISNVVNTNCLTMWGLDKKCDNIPTFKCDTVVFTITSVLRQAEADKKLIEILLKNYTRLFFWPQADTDMEYLVEIMGDGMRNINVIERSLSAYTAFLRKTQVDYVGSRLHGGIHALQNGRRTIIIAVDNRATEIKKDTNLPVIAVEDVKILLEDMINSEWKTDIHLNTENINHWMGSFSATLRGE